MLVFLIMIWLVLLVTIAACGGASRYLENHDDVREALERYGRVAQARLGNRPSRRRMKRPRGERKTLSAASPKMVTLQRWFVEGKISLEQYEREVERLGGSRA